MSRNAMQPLGSKWQVEILLYIIHAPAEIIGAGYYQKSSLSKCFAVQDDVLEQANLASNYCAIFRRAMKIEGHRIALGV